MHILKEIKLRGYSNQGSHVSSLPHGFGLSDSVNVSPSNTSLLILVE